MIFYLVPFVFLTIFTGIEFSGRFNSLIKNKYLYSFIALFFIIFIWLRYEVGCDWADYENMFEKYNSLNIIQIIEKNLFAKYKLEEIGHIFLLKSRRISIFLTLFILFYFHYLSLFFVLH